MLIRKSVYFPCDFGKRLFLDREAFMEEISVLDERDRDSVAHKNLAYFRWKWYIIFKNRGGRLRTTPRGT